MMKQTIFLLFILASLNAMSQDITHANISWQVSRMSDMNTGAFDEPGGRLLSYGNTRVEWRDANGALKQSFAIQETNGVWSNVATNGTILYEAESDGKECSITFVRDGSALRATIIVLPDNGLPLIYEFSLKYFITL